MRKLVSVIIWSISLISVCGLGACKSKSPNQQDIDSLAAADNQNKHIVQNMQESHMTDTVSWRNKIYTYSIYRHPDKTLAIVEDEQGQKYADNSIQLEVKNPDGSVFINKTFTKKAFASYLDNTFMEHSVLEGLVFDKVVPGGLQFAVSVCYPMSDNYIPLLLTVDSNGNISIKKDDVMDVEVTPDDEGV